MSKLLRFASQEKIPVTARGAGFGYVGGCVPVRGGIALSLARMNRIKEISFADSIAIVEPGVITAELQASAREQKLFYPPDPASKKDYSLITGAVAGATPAAGTLVFDQAGKLTSAYTGADPAALEVTGDRITWSWG